MRRSRRQVTRSSHLLVSLSAERGRWEAEAASFTAQMATVVGDPQGRPVGKDRGVHAAPLPPTQGDPDIPKQGISVLLRYIPLHLFWIPSFKKH